MKTTVNLQQTSGFGNTASKSLSASVAQPQPGLTSVRFGSDAGTISVAGSANPSMPEFIQTALSYLRTFFQNLMAALGINKTGQDVPQAGTDASANGDAPARSSLGTPRPSPQAAPTGRVGPMRLSNGDKTGEYWALREILMGKIPDSLAKIASIRTEFDERNAQYAQALLQLAEQARLCKSGNPIDKLKNRRPLTEEDLNEALAYFRKNLPNPKSLEPLFVKSKERPEQARHFYERINKSLAEIQECVSSHQGDLKQCADDLITLAFQTMIPKLNKPDGPIKRLGAIRPLAETDLTSAQRFLEKTLGEYEPLNDIVQPYQANLKAYALQLSELMINAYAQGVLDVGALLDAQSPLRLLGGDKPIYPVALESSITLIERSLTNIQNHLEKSATGASSVTITEPDRERARGTLNRRYGTLSALRLKREPDSYITDLQAQASALRQLIMDHPDPVKLRQYSLKGFQSGVIGPYGLTYVESGDPDKQIKNLISNLRTDLDTSNLVRLAPLLRSVAPCLQGEALSN